MPHPAIPLDGGIEGRPAGHQGCPFGGRWRRIDRRMEGRFEREMLLGSGRVEKDKAGLDFVDVWASMLSVVGP